MSRRPSIMLSAREKLLLWQRKCCRVVLWVEEHSKLAVVDDRGRIGVYLANGGQYLEITYALKQRVLGMCLNKKELLVSMGTSGELHCWDLSSNLRSLGSIDMRLRLSSICALTDSSVAVGTIAGSIEILEWDGSKFRRKNTKVNVHHARIDDLHAHNGLLVTGSSMDQAVAVMNIGLSFLFRFDLSERCFSVRVTRDYIAAGTKDYVHVVEIRGLYGMKMVGKICTGTSILWGMRFIDDEHLLVCGTAYLSQLNVKSGIVTDRIVASSKHDLDIDLMTNGNVAVVGAGVSQGHFCNNVILELEAHLTMRIATFVHGNAPPRSLTFRNEIDTNDERCQGFRSDAGYVRSQRDSKRPRLEFRNEGENQLSAVAHRQGDNAPLEDNNHLAQENQLSHENHGQKGSSFPGRADSAVMNPTSNLLQPVASSSVHVPSRNFCVELCSDKHGSGGEACSMGTKNEFSEFSALHENVEQEIMKWKEALVGYEEMSDFEPVQLAEAMDAYVITCRKEWKDTFPSLKKCLLLFLEDNFMLANDLIIKDAEKKEKVKDKIVSAARNNKEIGGRLECESRVSLFLKQFNKHSAKAD